MDCVTDGSVHFEPMATVPLKGVANPVALFIASRGALSLSPAKSGDG
jgi:hypothetical protein